MNTVHETLNKISSNHRLPILRILETGNRDTIDIASWVATKDNVEFDTVDLNIGIQEENHTILENHDNAAFCTFHTQDHKKYLTDVKWVDVVFLEPDDLQAGLEEFQLAASTGAKAIIIRDYQSKASIAVKQARRFGWTIEYNKDYVIISRPSI